MAVSSATLPLNLQPISVRTTSASLIFRPVKRMLVRQALFIKLPVSSANETQSSYANMLLENLFRINLFFDV